MRVSYLGPAGSYTEDALRAAGTGLDLELVPAASIGDAIQAVTSTDTARAFVPYENSIEGSVRPTLNALAFDPAEPSIIGEFDFRIHQCLIAREQLELDSIEVVISHPQGHAQCARFLRGHLPGAEVREASSTSEAVRQVSESDGPWAALGSEGAAALYGATVLRSGVEDEDDNVTRFVWIAVDPEATGDGAAGSATQPATSPTDGPWRTSLIFSEVGEDHPGALVEALHSFSDRGVNLSRIESRPLRSKLGRYMFFVDLDGGIAEAEVSEAIEALRSKAGSVRVLGSYRVSD